VTAPTATPWPPSPGAAPGRPDPLAAPVRRPSRVRELVAGTFTGTPGRLRLLGSIAIVVCLLFGAISFLAATRLHNDVSNARNNAAQLVRVQTIRTSLVKADANATNAFLVGGLEPAAVHAAYDAGVSTATSTLADAASANREDAGTLRRVNNVIADYAGLVESARANNRQGFPIGAAYLRQASSLIQDKALPSLATLVGTEQHRVDESTSATTSALAVLLVMVVIAFVALAVLQVWLFRKTRRVFNPSVLFATGLVLVIGIVGIGVMIWARANTSDARNGAYKQTVALATARINGFDAKSAEALTLINRGSGQAYDDRFKTVSKVATDAMAQDLAASPPTSDQARTVAAFNQYLRAHTQVRALDDGGSWDQAVALATGTGAANRDFATFEAVSDHALADQASQLSDDLGRALVPLALSAWLLLLAGIAAAVATWRGVNQRLREYR
jgi:hypothetical protein